MKNIIKSSAIVLALGAVSMSFGQTPLAPGNSVLLGSMSTTTFQGLLNSGNLVGNVIAPTFTGMDTFNNVKFTGTVLTDVWQNSVTGDLAFLYVIENNSSSVDAINHISVSGYSGFSTSVSQINDEGFGTASAYFASRSANGDVVSFSYLPGLGGEIAPGNGTFVETIFTNAKSFKIGSMQISDGGVATAGVYVPQAVPEPVSMLTLGSGLVGLIIKRRKK